MINVRLSEEEYLELERFCVARGARSISDLVRSTMHSVVTSGNQDSTLASSVGAYHAHVRELELRVEKLAAELELFRADVSPWSLTGPDAKDKTAITQPLANGEDAPDSVNMNQPTGKGNS
jgi:hypothetical protein